MIQGFIKHHLPSSLAAIFFPKHERTIRAQKNIFAMAIFKGINMATGFILVPLTLHYLNPTNYGLWMTISSIVGWFGFFDIGLGNGLRNKYTEAIARGDYEKARIYVSTTYAFLAGIICIVFFIFFLIYQVVNWYTVLNTTPAVTENLGMVVLTTVAFFCLRFVFGLIGTILTADQQPAITSLIEVVNNVLSLGIIWVLVKTTAGSLLYLSIAVSACSAGVPLVLSLWLYNRRYRLVRPSIQYVQKQYARELLNLGLRFFVLQAGFIIIFSTSNILITQLFSPADVTPYTIAYKYYNLLSMAFSILLAPFWSAYTDAYTRGDIDWIRRTMNVLKKAWFVMVVAVLLMSLGAETFYRLWVGKSISIPLSISISMGFYILLGAWCNIYVNFINGTGKIQLQFYTTIIISIVNIPLTIFLARTLHWGIPGVILAPSFCMLPLCILWPVQVAKILSGAAKGVWNR
jgi:O-antigen/teichoic acid export membrane protein